MGMHWRFDAICEGFTQRCLGIFARGTDRSSGACAQRWNPRCGQGVLVVGVCAASGHVGLVANVVGRPGRVSGIKRGSDHPYEVLITLSERVYLYDCFASWELAPLSGTAAVMDPSGVSIRDGAQTLAVEPG